MRIVLALALAAPLSAQAVRYEVSIPTPGDHLFHVKAEFPAAGEDTLLLSLPAWSPGAYEIQNYARYVRHFSAATTGGGALFWDRLDKDTWRVATGRAARVTIAFDFLADTVDLSLARIAGDFGQFLGTNLFLYAEGQLQRPAEVRFVLPAGWKVTTALQPAGGGVYTAPNYDELADAMTFVGKYSVDSLAVQGHWLRIALWPATDYTPAVARNLRDVVQGVAETQDQLMGGPPYERYTIFLNIIHGPLGFGGGLEHLASQYDILPAEMFADAAGNFGDFVRPLIAHESFHLWNVKRIRPAEMWPYDYHAEQYTPLLWWSEGVTDYYADLTNLRAGLWTPDRFFGNIEQNVEQVESAPEPWSEEDGSVATWINEVYVNSSQLYYPKGSLTGLLLDISIRDATANARGLDDVTRALFTRFYKQGKGFRTADLIALLRETGMPDAEGFYQRYINGRDTLPYAAVLAKAGIAFTRQTSATPFLGVSSSVGPGRTTIVQDVTPGSAAAEAGVQPGDVLIRVGDVPVTVDQDWAGTFRTRYQSQPGVPLSVTVQRGGQLVTLPTHVRERQTSSFTVGAMPNPTPQQAKLWHGLSTGTTGN